MPRPAGETLAAGLVLAEGHQHPGEVNGAGVLVGNYDAARAQDGPGLAHLIEVQVDGQAVGSEDAAKGPAGLKELQILYLRGCLPRYR